MTAYRNALDREMEGVDIMQDYGEQGNGVDMIEDECDWCGKGLGGYSPEFHAAQGGYCSRECLEAHVGEDAVLRDD